MTRLVEGGGLYFNFSPFNGLVRVCLNRSLENPNRTGGSSRQFSPSTPRFC